MEVYIIDYGMSNLGSIRRALEECGANAIVTDNPGDLKKATSIVLPGVGAFADGMDNLRSQDWIPAITENVVDDRVPLLGICLGMQLLADLGHEGGEVPGLGIIPGEVVRLTPSDRSTRIPHVGWNEVYGRDKSPLLDNIPDGSDFYFVHSYYLKAKDPENVLATTPYCGSFVSAVRKDNVMGVQFHPEKSGRMGFQLLKNFLRIQ